MWEEKMETKQPQRKRMRLPDYDYTATGAYYLTLCTQNKEKILCRIIPPDREGEAPRIILSPIGKRVEEMIQKIPGIDKYVIMPNHVHMIVMNDDSGFPLSRKIQYFKSNLTRIIGRSIWQREYYDHIIRNELDYQTKWKYIDDNPAKWADDDYY